MNNDILIRYQGVTIKQKEMLVLKEVDWTIKRGEFVYVIGKVGSGKSSLLKTLYSELPIEEGDAAIFDYNLVRIARKNVPKLRRQVGIVFQDFQLLTDRTVYKNLSFVLKATGWKSGITMDRRIEEVLKMVGMSTKGYKMPHELSGGEQQRIVIARALLNNPALILADEPTGNLDMETGNQIMQLLCRINKEQKTTIIITTHNLEWVNTYPGKLYMCNEHRLTCLNENTYSSLNRPDDDLR